MKTPAQWREIYPVAEEVVKAIQEDALGNNPDKERLDWLDSKSNGRPWIARQSEWGRGYRLHNIDGGLAWIDSQLGSNTREAIDKAIRLENQIISPHPAHPPIPAPAQPMTDPAARQLGGTGEGGEG